MFYICICRVVATNKNIIQIRSMTRTTTLRLERFYFMENQVEVWKDVLGYEGLYQVSNLGRVKSLKRIAVRTSKKGVKTNQLVNLNFNNNLKK